MTKDFPLEGVAVVPRVDYAEMTERINSTHRDDSNHLPGETVDWMVR
jgi:hypothetical protein